MHSAVLHDGRRVVVKLQYPGVARSIESDVDNLMRLISVANLLPKGLYVENAVEVRLVGGWRLAAAAAALPATFQWSVDSAGWGCRTANCQLSTYCIRSHRGLTEYVCLTEYKCRLCCQVAKRELKLECDYRHELLAQQRFKQLNEADAYTSQHFYVPAVVPELSTERMLVRRRAVPTPAPAPVLLPCCAYR